MTSQKPTIDPVVTADLVKQHGLTPEEFERIKKILGREPNFTELGIFSVMWSEHCSYKNSKRELKKFPTTGPNILVKAGEENAGVVDIGDGWAIAFKIESHNHPSAIEPFQGAATGVGGIIRDIFTMGARPEFCLNSLRFGPITEQSNSKQQTANISDNKRLFSGVVSGIAHYGNCVGVPTIGGEIYFDESFEGNPLVNVFCLGVLRYEQLARGAAKGVGNPVFYVGAETGRDGLAGAAFASRELTEQSREDRPAVQVGDPFKEKLLLEACLELLASDAVAGLLSVRPSYSFHVVEADGDGLVTGLPDVDSADLRVNGGGYLFRAEMIDRLGSGEDLVDAPTARGDHEIVGGLGVIRVVRRLEVLAGDAGPGLPSRLIV